MLDEKIHLGFDSACHWPSLTSVEPGPLVDLGLTHSIPSISSIAFRYTRQLDTFLIRVKRIHGPVVPWLGSFAPTDVPSPRHYADS